MGAKLIKLETEVLKRDVPSIFAKSANPKMSDKYVHVPSSDIIEQVEGSGYVVTHASQDTARERDPNYVRHFVRMTHESMLGAKVGDTVPQLTLENSGNGRTKLQFLAGFYRLLCENGMVGGGGSFTAFRVTHMRDIRAQIEEGIQIVQEQTERGMAMIEDWSKVKLSAQKQTNFAKRALVLRFGEDGAKAYEPKQLLGVRREGDEGADLWHVFNRVQEAIIRGGAEGMSANNRPIRARELKGITSQVQLNRGLWEAAEKLAA